MNNLIRTLLLPATGVILIAFTLWQGGFQNSDMMINVVFLLAMIALLVIVYAVAIRRLRGTMRDIDAAVRTLLEGKTYDAFTQEIFAADAGTDAGALRARNQAYLGRMRRITFGDLAVNEDWHRLLNDWAGSAHRGCEIEDYISEEEILENSHAGICAQLPGILTAMGILGTFIGLVVGLNRFDFTNAEEMISSVEALVGGLNVAFYTSIYGVTLSIVFNIVYRSELTALRIRLNRLYDVFNTALKPVKGADHSEDIYESVNAQTAQVTRIGELLSEDLGKNLGDQIAKSMLPEFDRINLSLQNVILDFQKKQANALEDIVAAFVGQMHGSLDSHINTLGASVDKLSSAQEEMTRDLRQLIDEISKTSAQTESVNDKADAIIRSLENYIQNLEETTAKSVEVSSRMQAYADSMQESLVRQEQTLETLSRHEASLDETCRQLNAGQDEMGSNLRSFSEAAAQLAGRELDPLQMQDIKSMLEHYMTQMLLLQQSFADRLDQERSRTFEHSAEAFETANRVLAADLKTQHEQNEAFMQDLVRQMKESLDALEKSQREVIYFSGLTASRLDPENKDIQDRISRPSFLGTGRSGKNNDGIDQLVQRMDAFMQRQEEMQKMMLKLQAEKPKGFFEKLAYLFRQ